LECGSAAAPFARRIQPHCVVPGSQKSRVMTRRVYRRQASLTALAGASGARQWLKHDTVLADVRESLPSDGHDASDDPLGFERAACAHGRGSRRDSRPRRRSRWDLAPGPSQKYHPRACKYCHHQQGRDRLTSHVSNVSFVRDIALPVCSCLSFQLENRSRIQTACVRFLL